MSAQCYRQPGAAFQRRRNLLTIEPELRNPRTTIGRTGRLFESSTRKCRFSQFTHQVTRSKCNTLQSNIINTLINPHCPGLNPFGNIAHIPVLFSGGQACVIFGLWSDHARRPPWVSGHGERDTYATILQQGSIQATHSAYQKVRYTKGEGSWVLPYRLRFLHRSTQHFRHETIKSTIRSHNPRKSKRDHHITKTKHPFSPFSSPKTPNKKTTATKDDSSRLESLDHARDPAGAAIRRLLHHLPDPANMVHVRAARSRQRGRSQETG